MPQTHLAGAGITFAVDNVSPAVERLPELASTRILEGALRGPIEACWAPERTLVGEEYPADFRDDSLAGTELENPLIFAVHLAFSEHRPLRLTPDAVWITIAQGFATHLRENAETLRRDLVDHQGKLLLTITRRDGFPDVEGFRWAAAIDEFAAQIRERTGDLHDLVICDFSTTGPAERTASQIVLMDAVTPYFDYGVRCVCGIPEVTLEGTPADWTHLEEKAHRLAHYGLGWWSERLLPICAELARSAKGEIDLEFWRRIYKRRDQYGGDIINGWIAELFPFIKVPTTERITEINPIFTSEGGVRSSRIPRGLTRVPFACDLGLGERALELVAGLVGVTQDPETLSLRPEVGWAVREGAEIDSVVRRLVALPAVAAHLRLGDVARAFPLPEATAVHADSNAGLRARGIGGASDVRPRCARMAMTTSRSETSLVRCADDVRARPCSDDLGHTEPPRRGRVRATAEASVVVSSASGSMIHQQDQTHQRVFGLSHPSGWRRERGRGMDWRHASSYESSGASFERSSAARSSRRPRRRSQRRMRFSTRAATSARSARAGAGPSRNTTAPASSSGRKPLSSTMTWKCTKLPNVELKRCTKVTAKGSPSVLGFFTAR